MGLPHVRSTTAPPTTGTPSPFSWLRHHQLLAIISCLAPWDSFLAGLPAHTLHPTPPRAAEELVTHSRSHRASPVAARDPEDQCKLLARTPRGRTCHSLPHLFASTGSSCTKPAASVPTPRRLHWLLRLAAPHSDTPSAPDLQHQVVAPTPPPESQPPGPPELGQQLSLSPVSP